MKDYPPWRHSRAKVTCPACQGLGRNGPEGSVCRVCWLTGVIDAGRYERIKAARQRRGDDPQPTIDGDGDSGSPVMHLSAA
jgi:hypothetical protein